MTTTVKLTVTGMKCGGCENTVKKALTGKEAIVSVDASHADDWVEIEYDETVIDEDAVIEVIEGAGFTVVD
ncbi:MAG: heavy-metal-associated domain-containing protein [Methyloprofundus sp.]|uniref:heavy-metal-associated domain-containing protein n=1 Tax=Methyloprofundus sp. TaxID=2020875 RepID=UPI001A15C5B2|nr:heavy-metal-associated domain-containing protein [Methyloprofundus sp.]HIL77745.1 copper chaperone [Methylococcales bacterium]